MGALVLRLLGAAASGLGLSLPLAAFLAGLACAAPPVGWAAWKLGHWIGWDAGAAAADRTAEVNALTRERDEARADADNAAQARDAARAGEAASAAARSNAETERDDYARELAKRGPAAACGLTDADLARMLGNAWDKPRAARRPSAPGGR